MAHLSEGHPMCQNGVNILKLIDEGPFQMGTFRETLAEGTKGALHLGTAGYGGAQNRVGNANLSSSKAGEWGGISENSYYFLKVDMTTLVEDVDEQPVQDLDQCG
ncbi:hypothetical protein Tco_0539959 [Tanacetum coccineum]